MFSSTFSVPWVSAFHSRLQKCQEKAGFMVSSVRLGAVNSEPTLTGYLSLGAKTEGERPGSLAAQYCAIVLRFIPAGRSARKPCGNAR